MKLVETTVKAFKQYYWPLDELTYVPDDFDRLSEDEKEIYRTKNRWQMIHLKPYISRWLALVAVTGLLLSFIMTLPGLWPLPLFLVALAAFAGSVFGCGTIIWMYSQRPKTGS